MSAVPGGALGARWAALAPRERRLVGGGGLLLALVLAWVLAVEPAWRGRQRLERDLPELRAQVAQMDALVAEARRLAGTGGAAMPIAAVRDELVRSANAAGLPVAPAQAVVQGDRIEMRFPGVPFGSWLAWADGAQRSLRLRIAQVAVQRGSAEGGRAPTVLGSPAAPGTPAGAGDDSRVNVTVAFEQPRIGAGATGGGPR